jgi:osmoprotectant transport system ATP-binding protein
MIELDRLSRIFVRPDGTQAAAVDGVSLHIPAGEICVFLGPSGCGKTTTLKMINRLVTPSSGRVLIDGRDVADADEVELRRQIGYVIQQVGLFPNMTVEENVTVVPRLLGWPRPALRRRAAELMAMVALDPDLYMKRYPHELSGGQQQRVGVIRALAADPPVLLMDEPFGAVDPVNRESIQREFLALQRQLRTTVVMVSHDIDEAIRLGDSIAVFRQGKLVQCGRPDDLLARPRDAFVSALLGQDSTLRRLMLVRAGDAATRTATVHVDVPVRQARRMMRASGLDRLVVVDAAERAQGYIRHDASRRMQGRCGEHLQRFPAAVQPDDNLRIVLSRLVELNATWLPVITRDGRHVGEITHEAIGNCVGAAARAPGETADV